jgi:hypothetical protein
VFTMSGDQGETLPVRLHDRERPCFERGQTNSFVIAYPHGVGDLSYVQIWHDNSGTVEPELFSNLPELMNHKTNPLVSPAGSPNNARIYCSEDYLP